LLPAVSRDEAQRSSDIKLPDVDLAERAMLLVKLGNLYNRVGDCQKAVEYLERGLNLARMADDRQAEIAALSRLAQLDSERGSYDTAQRYLDEVLLLAREQEDQDTVASALSMLSTIAWKWGDLERAEECCRESLGIYRELGNRREVPQMLNILGILATLQENYDLAEKQYEQGLTMAREVDDRQLVADLLNNLGYLNHHCTGSLKKAKRRYQESLLIAREIGHCFGVTSTLINLGQLHIRLGEPQIAWEYLREALQESVAIGAVPLTLEALVGVARQRTEAGQPMAAAELLGLVLNHPALEIDTRQEADSALGELRQVMSAKQLESALERGKVLEMGAVIAELEAMMAKMLEGPPI
jgi:tetratricopeptide (TPR) repeat protein